MGIRVHPGWRCPGLALYRIREYCAGSNHRALDNCIVDYMRILLSVAAILLISMGAIFFLQGINVLPGSVMTGQIQWAFYGAIAIIAGLGLLAFANRRRASQPRK